MGYVTYLLFLYLHRTYYIRIVVRVYLLGVLLCLKDYLYDNTLDDHMHICCIYVYLFYILIGVGLICM